MESKDFMSTTPLNESRSDSVYLPVTLADMRTEISVSQHKGEEVLI